MEIGVGEQKKANGGNFRGIEHFIADKKHEGRKVSENESARGSLGQKTTEQWSKR